MSQFVTQAGGPGSNPGRTLKTCNFEALENTVMYFTFFETCNLFLFGQERSRPYLRFEYPKSLCQDTRFHYSFFTSEVYLHLAECRGKYIYSSEETIPMQHVGKGKLFPKLNLQ